MSLGINGLAEHTERQAVEHSQLLVCSGPHPETLQYLLTAVSINKWWHSSGEILCSNEKQRTAATHSNANDSQILRSAKEARHKSTHSMILCI